MERIILAHGGGGRLSGQIISELFLKYFDNPILNALEDASLLNIEGKRLAFTTDSFVITPPFFPGGDIGKLAVCGTVNDLTMRGAKPLYLSAAFILEEGFPISDLEKIVKSMAETCEMAGAKIVAGDTKVVGKGAVDGIFINTTGIGIVDDHINISVKNAEVGDKIILTGTLGDHGIAILSIREGISFETEIKSDCSPLNLLFEGIFEKYGEYIHVMRDPTRGGLAAVLNEIASGSGKGILIYENRIPYKEEVLNACYMLGLDPLHLANEGKAVMIVSQDKAEEILNRLKEHPLGRDASIIGEVLDADKNVYLKTSIGTTRIVDVPAGELLPRIC